MAYHCKPPTHRPRDQTYSPAGRCLVTRAGEGGKATARDPSDACIHTRMRACTHMLTRAVKKGGAEQHAHLDAPALELLLFARAQSHMGVNAPVPRIMRRARRPACGLPAALPGASALRGRGPLPVGAARGLPASARCLGSPRQRSAARLCCRWPARAVRPGCVGRPGRVGRATVKAIRPSRQPRTRVKFTAESVVENPLQRKSNQKVMVPVVAREHGLLGPPAGERERERERELY